MSNPRITRRDQCYLVGKRAENMTIVQAANAWYGLAGILKLTHGRVDASKMPRYKDIIGAIRRATISAKRPT